MKKIISVWIILCFAVSVVIPRQGFGLAVMQGGAGTYGNMNKIGHNKIKVGKIGKLANIVTYTEQEIEEIIAKKVLKTKESNNCIDYSKQEGFLDSFKYSEINSHVSQRAMVGANKNTLVNLEKGYYPVNKLKIENFPLYYGGEGPASRNQEQSKDFYKMFYSIDANIGICAANNFIEGRDDKFSFEFLNCINNRTQTSFFVKGEKNYVSAEKMNGDEIDGIKIDILKLTFTGSKGNKKIKYHILPESNMTLNIAIKCRAIAKKLKVKWENVLFTCRGGVDRTGRAVIYSTICDYLEKLADEGVTRIDDLNEKTLGEIIKKLYIIYESQSTPTFGQYAYEIFFPKDNTNEKVKQEYKKERETLLAGFEKFFSRKLKESLNKTGKTKQVKSNELEQLKKNKEELEGYINICTKKVQKLKDCKEVQEKDNINNIRILAERVKGIIESILNNQKQDRMFGYFNDLQGYITERNKEYRGSIFEKNYEGISGNKINVIIGNVVGIMKELGLDKVKKNEEVVTIRPKTKAIEKNSYKQGLINIGRNIPDYKSYDERKKEIENIGTIQKGNVWEVFSNMFGLMYIENSDIINNCNGNNWSGDTEDFYLDRYKKEGKVNWEVLNKDTDASLKMGAKEHFLLAYYKECLKFENKKSDLGTIEECSVIVNNLGEVDNQQKLKEKIVKIKESLKKDEIIKNLFIGTKKVAEEILQGINAEQGFGAVLSLVDCKKDFINKDLNHYNCIVKDFNTTEEDINKLNDNMIDMFETMIDTLKGKANKKGLNKVLVNCKLGSSRSATVVAGFLMVVYDVTFVQAHNFLKSKRAVVEISDTWKAYLTNDKKSNYYKEINFNKKEKQKQLFEKLNNRKEVSVKMLLGEEHKFEYEENMTIVRLKKLVAEQLDIFDVGQNNFFLMSNRKKLEKWESVNEIKNQIFVFIDENKMKKLTFQFYFGWDEKNKKNIVGKLQSLYLPVQGLNNIEALTKYIEKYMLKNERTQKIVGFVPTTILKIKDAIKKNENVYILVEPFKTITIKMYNKKLKKIDILDTKIEFEDSITVGALKKQLEAKLDKCHEFIYKLSIWRKGNYDVLKNPDEKIKVDENIAFLIEPTRPLKRINVIIMNKNKINKRESILEFTKFRDSITVGALKKQLEAKLDVCKKYKYQLSNLIEKKEYKNDNDKEIINKDADIVILYSEKDNIVDKTLTVRGNGEKLFDIKFAKSISVKELKEKISKEKGYNKVACKFIYKGEELKDEDIIKEDNCMIHLVLKLISHEDNEALNGIKKEMEGIKARIQDQNQKYQNALLFSASDKSLSYVKELISLINNNYKKGNDFNKYYKTLESMLKDNQTNDIGKNLKKILKIMIKNKESLELEPKIVNEFLKLEKKKQNELYANQLKELSNTILSIFSSSTISEINKMRAIKKKIIKISNNLKNQKTADAYEEYNDFFEYHIDYRNHPEAKKFFGDILNILQKIKSNNQPSAQGNLIKNQKEIVLLDNWLKDLNLSENDILKEKNGNVLYEGIESVALHENRDYILTLNFPFWPIILKVRFNNKTTILDLKEYIKDTANRDSVKNTASISIKYNNNQTGTALNNDMLLSEIINKDLQVTFQSEENSVQVKNVPVKDAVMLNKFIQSAIDMANKINIFTKYEPKKMLVFKYLIPALSITLEETKGLIKYLTSILQSSEYDSHLTMLQTENYINLLINILNYAEKNQKIDIGTLVHNFRGGTLYNSAETFLSSLKIMDENKEKYKVELTGICARISDINDINAYRKRKVLKYIKFLFKNDSKKFEMFKFNRLLEWFSSEKNKNFKKDIRSVLDIICKNKGNWGITLYEGSAEIIKKEIGYYTTTLISKYSNNNRLTQFLNVALYLFEKSLFSQHDDVEGIKQRFLYAYYVAVQDGKKDILKALNFVKVDSLSKQEKSFIEILKNIVTNCNKAYENPINLFCKDVSENKLVGLSDSLESIGTFLKNA